MSNRERGSAPRAQWWVATVGGVMIAAVGGQAAAAGWQLSDFETPLGDRGVALLVTARETPDVRLGIGCDADRGDRWRGVAVIEEPKSPFGLGVSGTVRIRFGTEEASDTWAVKTTAAGRLVYTAPESTKLARRLASEEARSKQPEVAIELRNLDGKPVVVTFPLAGLKAEIGKIAKRCADWDL